MAVQRVDQADILFSWFLQGAIITAFALSSFGVTAVLRRPAMKQLSVIWGFYVLAGFTGMAGSWMTVHHQTGPLAVFFMTCSSALVVGTLPTNLALADSLAGNPRRWMRHGLEPVLMAVVAFLVIGLGTSGLAPGLSVSFWPRIWTSGMYVLSGSYAYRLSKREHGYGPALRLLAGGFALMAARVVVNMAFALNAPMSTPSAPDTTWLTMSQVFSIVLFGTMSLLAVLDQERSAIMDQAELLRSVEMRLASSRRLESLGRFAAGIAHDFNNVLTAIMAGSGLARDAVNDAKELNAELDVVDDAVTRAAELVRRLQLFARDEGGVSVMEDANQRVSQLTGMLNRVLGGDVTLSVRTADAPLVVRIDPTRLDQVILNLVVNARDAMPTGGTILVEASRATFDRARQIGDTVVLPGDYARIAVSDSGTGIDPRIMEHLFEPFFTTKPEGGGSGIGLATCQSVVLEAGGAIDVESTLGKGSRFDAYFPIATDRA